MRRRKFILLTGSAALCSFSSHARQAGKTPRIGYLGVTSHSDRPALLDTFRQGLRKRGWIEGQNIVIDYRFAEGRLDRLPDLAAELVRLKVDVIVSLGTQGVTAAKNATKTIPIVMIGVRDPVGTGLIASLAHPGGNITGVSGSAGLEIVTKQLELLKETVPKILRVGILSNPANAYHQLAIKELNVAARSLGLQLQLLEARGPNEFNGAFAAMAKERVEALLVLSDVIFNDHRALLVDLAAMNRLPAAYGIRESVEAGGLISYGPSFLDFYRRSTAYVDRILKGHKPVDLPVEQPTKFELVVNLRTAKTLGIEIAPTLLSRADEVIE
ncbi:ABC transporter substrate-binding protein [Bradyrhizobium liaoningense]|uniref:ABC transporter substrate-binding protein n=1 Tax=Bradyrhizobium liaoningense TaxID=43992 RepID=UPI001BAC893A|nr:ABC transporter substrate-binding protein [Bradyrhizobium liaoningense]MBR0738185.1 ABC transporter substrate-binding protein [Bradyrhizobium liaoningense]